MKRSKTGGDKQKDLVVGKQPMRSLSVAEIYTHYTTFSSLFRVRMKTDWYIGTYA